mgnify:CR=1 FL=1
MPRKLRIPKDEKEHERLKLLLHLSPDILDQLLQALQQEPPALELRKLAKRLKGKIDLPLGDLVKLLASITNLYMSFNGIEIPVEEFSEAFREALESTGNPDLKLSKSQWDVFKKYIPEILKCENSIGITAKALDVMAEHQHVFLNARIITDLRPLFSKDLEKGAEAAVIIHQLKLDYLESEDSKSFFVAMDSEDLERLEQLIDRAKSKEQGLRRAIKKTGMHILE